MVFSLSCFLETKLYYLQMKRILLLLLSVLLYGNSFSQLWVEMKNDPNANFYDIQAEFESYWAGRTIEKGKGYKAFRRWEDLMAPRVYPKGDLKLAGRARAYEEFQKYKAEHPEYFANDRASNWVPLGPTGAPAGGGAGRVNRVRFDPTNSNTVFACTPSGGLWKSTNSGTSWANLTDNLAVIGCTDVAIDPTNTNIMYLATSDGDAGDTYSIGVLKSTNGGATWAATGLSWTVNQGRTISKLIMHPTNSNIIIAATSNGIYRTTNAGTSWTQVLTGSYKDIEFKPTDPNTVYAAGTSFYRSTDNGATWTAVTTGLPTTGVSRMAIGVTDANTAYVYLLVSRSSDEGFQGVYRSTNSGTSFTTRSTTPNILGWDNGGDAGGQGWYDLCIAVSPTNADEVYTGGVNTWKSTNGGTTFTLNTHWYGGFSKPYVHADIHDLIFLPGSSTTVWSSNDGGVFRTTNSGTSWSDLSSNLQIAMQYRVGLSTSNPSLLVTGHQDNGTNKMNGTTWTQIYGGDGMEGFIDRTNNNNIFASYVYGDYNRSTDGGATWTAINTGLTGTAAWLAPWHQDPVTAATLYSGRTQMFKSTNSGTSWSQIGTITGTGTIVEFDVAPSNTQYIYAVRSNAVFKTTNGGTSWTNVTGTLPVASAALTNVEICPTDPLKVWVTFSGYSSGNKIFMTTDGGTTWTNYSTGLPNLPANCVVYQNATSDGLYIGTDVGVYYRDASLTSWQPYLTGLPNVIVRDLEIYYGTGKIRAGTYGRSTWESDLYSPGTNPPIADFTVNRKVICAGQSVTFTDLSAYTPTSWSWSFTGGTPGTSTLQNPTVTYNTPGTYAVTLTATNAYGSDPETKTAYITVMGSVALPVTEGFEGATFAPANWAVLDKNSNGLTWTRNGSLGAYGTSTACAMWDNYNNDDAGARDEIWSSRFDFSGLTSATLTFDVAYARYNATYSDTLAVLVSTDCGTTWNQVYLKGGTTLSTNGGTDLTTAQFVPTTTQWRNENVSLNTFLGQPSVIIVFQNRARYGQALYLDNINITGVGGSLPVANFTASATNVCAGSTVTFTNTTTGGTSYSWTFPGGTPGTSTATNPTVTYNTPGTYNVTLVATNASGSDTELKTAYITVVGAPTAANAGTDQTVCAGSTATLAGNSPTTGTGAWSFVSGPSTPTITTPSSPTSTVTGLTTAGTYTLQWTISNAPCTASSDQMIITVNAAPTTANAGPDQTVCAGSTVTMAGNTATSGTGVWTKISGPAGGTITTPSSATTTITGLTTGTYVYQWTISNAPCTASSDQVTITVNGTPTTANAGVDQTICSGSTVTLAGNTPTVGTGSWSFISGPATPTITTPSSPTSTVTGLTTAGTYTLRWTISNAPCTASTDNMIITVNAAPTTANAGPDQTICAGSTVTMAGNTPTSGTGVWTKISGPAGGTITTPSSATTTITGLTTGTYVYQWTISNAPCTASSDQMTITVNGTPTTANAGVDQSICMSATLTFAGNTPTVGTGTWTQVSGPVTATITTPTSATSTATGFTTTGTYVFQWTISNAPCTASSDQMTVTVTTGPTTANAGVDQTLCSTTTTAFMAANTPTSGTGLWTKISGPAGGAISSATNPNTTITGLTAGTYVYQWTITSGTCPASTDQVTITVNAPPTTANAGVDQSICSTTATMAGNTPTSGTGAWTFVSGPVTPVITTPGSATSSITGLTVSGTYIFTWTISNSPCAASSDNVSIVVTAPPTAAATSNSPVCTTDTLELFTPTVAGATYSWTGPGTYTSSSQNPIRLNATTAMAGTYTVTVSVGACTSTSSTTVVVNASPTGSATNTSPVCEGQTFNISVPTSSSSTYSWTGPLGYTSSTRVNTLGPATLGMAGVYTVTVTKTATGCSRTTSTTVTITPGPTSSAASNAPLCEGDTLSLTTPTAAGATYSWTGPGGFTSSLQNPFVNGVTAASTGTYTVTVTAGSCFTSSSVPVTVSSMPTANPSSNSPLCEGDSLLLTTGTVAGATYTWSGPGGFTATTDSPTLAGATPTNSGVYTVVVAIGGCSDTSSTSVNIDAMPIANAGTDVSICEGQPTNLNATGGTTYSWTPSTGLSSATISNPIATPTITTTYTVNVANGICSASDQVIVNVNSLPSTPTIVQSLDTLTAVPSTGFTYQWYLDGNPITGATSSTYISTANGVYTVVITDANGCTASSAGLTYSIAGITVNNAVIGSAIVIPNPNDGNFVLNIELQQSSDLDVYIHNSIGELVYTKHMEGAFKSSSINFNLNDLSTGAYTLTVSNGKGAIRNKLIVK